jgi:hypothetical protein
MADGALLRTLQDKASNYQVGARRRSEEHRRASSVASRFHLSLLAVSAVTSAFASAAIFANATSGLKYVAASAALTAAIATGVDVTFGFSTIVNDNKIASDGFAALRTSWLQFRDVTGPAASSDDELQQEFDRMLEAREQLAARSPMITERTRSRVERDRDQARADFKIGLAADGGKVTVTNVGSGTAFDVSVGRKPSEATTDHVELTCRLLDEFEPGQHWIIGSVPESLEHAPSILIRWREHRGRSWESEHSLAGLRVIEV